MDDILDLARSTRAGVATPAATREKIADLADRLAPLCPRAPAKSPLLYGTYDVTYCSNPAAPGGPVLTSGAGRALAQGQVPVQTLEPASVV